LLVATGCPKQKEIPAPEPPPGEGPIDTLLQLLGKDREAMTLPRADEARYRLPLRFPVIEAALARPLALPTWADSVGARLDRATSIGEIWAALQSLSPAGTAEAVAPIEAVLGLEGMPPPRTRLRSPAPLPRDAFATSQAQVQMAQLPEAFLSQLIALAGLLQDIEAAAETWYRLDGLIRRPDRAPEEFFIDRYSGLYRILTHPVGVQLEFLRSAVFIDQRALSNSAAQLLIELEQRLPALAEAAAELPASEGRLLHLDTRLGPIIVGSTGTDLHSDDAFLLVDPGGNDQWNNNAGATGGLNSSVSLAIDLGGDDEYRNERGHAQGSGFMGIGVLVDWGEGADRYAAGAQSQGAGFMGIGVLWDRGGDDSYRSSGFAQGAGTFGIGMLLDEAGNDTVVAASRAQGFASTGGLGVYLDLDGDDERRVGIPGSRIHSVEGGGGQAAAWGTRPFPWWDDLSLHGGVALLYDRAGNDRYFARAMGQGSAWFLSLALLLDRAGNDQYLCVQNCQGSASHLSAALLLDGGGSDRYEGSQSVQGAGNDRSVGVLWDKGSGHDIYRLAAQGRENPREIGRGQGFARQPHAIGVLVDGGGDDNYAVQREALGHSEATSHPGRNPTALLIDLGGQDRYAEAEPRAGAIPRDSSSWLSGPHAGGMDAFFASPGWDTASLEPAEGFAGLSWDRSLLSGEAGPEAEAGAEAEAEPAGDPPPPPGNPPPPPGDLDGDETARWQWLRARFEQLTAASEPAPLSEDEIATLSALAETDPSTTVRRAAARLLVGAGLPLGLRVLIASLSQPSQDNPGAGRGTGELGAWLGLATGAGLDFSAEQWRQWYQDKGKSSDFHARWPAIARLEAAASAAEAGQVEKMATLCGEARDLLPGDAWVDSRASALVGRWAWVLGHPESHGHRDARLAVELASLWVGWQPDLAQPFITLAQAWFSLGEFDLARKALDKSEILDPDNIRMLSLRRAMEDHP
jgi:hypothetical protein